VITGIVIATAIGTAIYVWLTVSTLPITRGLRATLRSRWRYGWPYALPLAIGVSMMTAAIALAVAIVIAMVSPYIGGLLGDPVLVTIGSIAGLVPWCARTAVLGAPRLSPDVELALVLAIVALRSDDAALLSTVEREYTRQVLLNGDAYLPRVARTVLGV
jgi:hypothetical protein